jgi:RHS repeat-associated protein
MTTWRALANRGTADSNGNTLTSVTGSNTTTYAWDYENRLSSVTLPGSGGTVSFKYDPFGRRIYKSSSSGTSIFAYDGDNLLEETNASGAVVARYSHGVKIDEPLAMLHSSATSYYHADGLGSVTSLSNTAGSLAQTYAFDSFGKATTSTGSLTNPFRYTGREFDVETNLYFLRARYYDQNAGRFLSEDPIKFDGGANFYRYVGNDPIDSTDSYGLVQLCCRPARSVTWLGINGCHCFLKLSDGTTLGGYWKTFTRDTTWGLLEKRPNYGDDKHPADQPDCKDLPGSECAVRRAFGDLPKYQPYIPFYLTSNYVPAATLTLAGIPFRMPSCAFGAFPFNLGALGSKAPVPIGSVPKVNF